jgi:hypothetical protein
MKAIALVGIIVGGAALILGIISLGNTMQSLGEHAAQINVTAE